MFKNTRLGCNLSVVLLMSGFIPYVFHICILFLVNIKCTYRTCKSIDGKYILINNENYTVNLFKYRGIRHFGKSSIRDP